MSKEKPANNKTHHGKQEVKAKGKEEKIKTIHRG